MAEVLQLANKVLPLSLAAKIQVSACRMGSDDAGANLVFFPSSLSQMCSIWPQTMNAENTGSSVHPHYPPSTASIGTELG
jgi:hypothetical protein